MKFSRIRNTAKNLACNIHGGITSGVEIVYIRYCSTKGVIWGIAGHYRNNPWPAVPDWRLCCIQMQDWCDRLTVQLTMPDKTFLRYSGIFIYKKRFLKIWLAKSCSWNFETQNFVHHLVGAGAVMRSFGRSGAASFGRSWSRNAMRLR
jgi:hypothetical protein